MSSFPSRYKTQPYRRQCAGGARASSDGNAPWCPSNHSDRKDSLLCSTISVIGWPIDARYFRAVRDVPTAFFDDPCELIPRQSILVGTSRKASSGKVTFTTNFANIINSLQPFIWRPVATMNIGSTNMTKLAANRANAQHSTGPKDTTKTRFNGVQHGLTSKQTVIPGESQEEYDKFHAEIPPGPQPALGHRANV